MLSGRPTNFLIVLTFRERKPGACNRQKIRRERWPCGQRTTSLCEPVGQAMRPGSPRCSCLPGGTRYHGVVAEEKLQALEESEIAVWLETLIGAGDTSTTVAQSAGHELLGFCRHGRDPDDEARGHVFSLYVTPAASGRGLGSRLLTSRAGRPLPARSRPGHDLGLRAEHTGTSASATDSDSRRTGRSESNPSTGRRRYVSAGPGRASREPFRRS